MDLYIIGAGNVGGFIAYHVKDMGTFQLKGFLDDDKSKHGKRLYDIPVVGFIDMLYNTSNEVAVVIAIANPLIKQQIVSKLKNNNLIHFPSFIHPSVWLGEKVRVGEGAIIYPGVSINYESDIQDFSTINMNVAIGHNCLLGAYSTLAPGVNLGGFTSVGVASFLGIGSSTIQGVKIGENVTIGGMSMIIASIPNGVTVVGNPGRIIKK